PLILCELEGRSRKEVARHLGLPEGTLSSRLATARKLLARRLTRRGVTSCGGLVAALVSGERALADVPCPIAPSTLKAVARISAGQAVTDCGVSAKVVALTQGVLKAMGFAKVRLICVTLAAALAVAFSGTPARTGGPAGDGESARPAATNPAFQAAERPPAN